MLVQKRLSDSSTDMSEQSSINMKEPKRVLHFSDGTLEEYSTDEDIEDQVDKKTITPSTSSNNGAENQQEWIPWVVNTTSSIGYKTLEVCDSVGESLASFFGITSPKYQAEIEHYNHNLKTNQNIESKPNIELTINSPVDV